jgi:DNA-binding NarL/FixJ family response regulator
MGVSGYISKRSEKEVLNGALRLILEGGTYLPPSVLQPTTVAIVQDNTYRTGKSLTNRQNLVLGLVAQGLSNKQIAYEMGVSEATVKLHINALLRSVGATNRTQAVIMAQKMGII